MEPPAKRRRHDSSPVRIGQNDDDEDDELASHPQEISVRRDPDIQLALKRANADHKLQATMAHIIEKYSRNFDGVGDEIDMETGEIVVNNGHLRNMRDEGDVEGLWMEGNSNVDEYEGILLEDLTDEYSDNEAVVNEVQDSQRDDDEGGNSNTGEQGMNTASKPSDARSGSIPAPAATEAQDNMLRDPDQRLPPEHPDPYNSALGDPSPFGRPSFGHGSSPLGYGGPAAPFGPWAMMPGFPMHAWVRDDIPPYYIVPPNMPGPWFSGGRYNFPTNNGQTSIWGRGWAKKTKRAGSMKRFSKGPAKSSEQPGDSQQNQDDESDDRDDTNAIDTGTGDKQPATQEAQMDDRVINASDEEDDLLLSGGTDLEPPSRSSPICQEAKKPAKRNTKGTLTGKVLEETNGNSAKVPPRDDGKDEGDRRRSGRARKQVEYMGKISWTEAKEWQKSGQSLSVELPRPDPATRGDFQSVDNTDDEGPQIEKLSQGTAPRRSQGEAPKSTLKQIIPDSQDTTTPFNSSAPQGSQLQSQETPREPKTIPSSAMPTVDLSDDEAPLLLLSRVNPPRQTAASPNSAARPSSPAGEQLDPNHSASGMDAHQSMAEEEHHEAIICKPIDPKGRADMSATQPEQKIAAPVDRPAPSLKRKRGRPRRSDVTVSGLSGVATTSSGSQRQMRGPGRPRRSSVVARVTEVQAQTSHGVALGQEQQSDDHAGAEGEKLHRLSHEIRWLQSTKPKGGPGGQLRTRRSKEVLQPHAADSSVPTGASKEPKPPSPATRASSPNDSLLPSMKPQDLVPQPASTPRKTKELISHPAGTPSNSSRPQTPRHSSIRTAHAPSSRRSLLSFVSDSESDSDRSRDELTRNIKSTSRKTNRRSATHKLWQSTALTTEVARTPSRRRGVDPSSPGNTVKTPGGTVRTCGVDGYQCGRDFCFTCL